MSDQLQMTDGMHIIVEALKQNNIDTIYGVVGIPVTDMARHAQAEGIRYIGFRHEQSAGYAAAVLQELGYSDDEIAAMKQNHAI
nr:hypothetical protein [Escherichia coli]